MQAFAYHSTLYFACLSPMHHSSSTPKTTYGLMPLPSRFPSLLPSLLFYHNYFYLSRVFLKKSPIARQGFLHFFLSAFLPIQLTDNHANRKLSSTVPTTESSHCFITSDSLRRRLSFTSVRPATPVAITVLPVLTALPANKYILS